MLIIKDPNENKPASSEDEELLAALVTEVSQATARAKDSLAKGLADAEQALAEIRRAV